MSTKVILAALLFLASLGNCNLWAQENTETPSVLHIQHSVTTSKTGFPQFLYMYKVLDGGKSAASVEALTGDISLENYSPNFSEVLWLIAYWQGKCPVNDQSLNGASFLWSDILKNPSQSVSQLHVDLHFPHALPVTGCIGFVFGGGPLVEGKVTMSADLNLTYEPSPSPNTVIDLSGEYCFGQDWGCQNATVDDEQGFAVPIVMMQAGHLVELYGDIGDSTFDGTENFGPLPTGNAWGALNNFYLLPGGCGKFGGNLNSQGFPKPVLLSKLYSWLPDNALHLESVPMEYKIPDGEMGVATLQKRVEKFFAPVAVNSGDCMVVIYGRQGDGATDNETQVKAVLAP